MAQIVDGDVLIVSPERLLKWNLPAALLSWQSLVLHLFLVVPVFFFHFEGRHGQHGQHATFKAILSFKHAGKKSRE